MQITIPKAKHQRHYNQQIHKRRNCTLSIWRNKNFATSQLLVQIKATETPLRMTISTRVFDKYLSWLVRLFILICVGLSALLVWTNRAMRRPLLHKTGDRIGSTFFYVNTQDNNKKISHTGVYGKKIKFTL